MAKGKTLIQTAKEIALLPADVWWRFMVTIAFVSWLATEGKEQWFPTYNSDDVIAGIASRLDSIEMVDMTQDMEHQQFQVDYIEAGNMMQRLNDKLDRELQILHRDVDRNYERIDARHP